MKLVLIIPNVLQAFHNLHMRTLMFWDIPGIQRMTALYMSIPITDETGVLMGDEGFLY